MIHTWHKGIFEYGGLASRLGNEFEAKWLASGDKVDPSSLSEPDFSATTDLYSVSANVYTMRPILFEPRSVVSLGFATLLPFAPIWLSVVPAKTVITQLLHLLM